MKIFRTVVAILSFATVIAQLFQIDYARLFSPSNLINLVTIIVMIMNVVAMVMSNLKEAQNKHSQGFT